jgi:hypothetical protein
MSTTTRAAIANAASTVTPPAHRLDVGVQRPVDDVGQRADDGIAGDHRVQDGPERRRAAMVPIAYSTVSDYTIATGE